MSKINSATSFSAGDLTPTVVRENVPAQSQPRVLPQEITLEKPNPGLSGLTDFYNQVRDALAPGIFSPNTTDQGTVQLTPDQTNKLFQSGLEALKKVPLSALSPDEQQFFERATGKKLDLTKTTLGDAVSSALGNQVNEFRKNNPGVAEAAVATYIAVTGDLSGTLNKLGVLPLKIQSSSSNTVNNNDGSATTTNQKISGEANLAGRLNEVNLVGNFNRERTTRQGDALIGQTTTGVNVQADNVLRQPRVQATFDRQQIDNRENGSDQTSAHGQVQYDSKTGLVGGQLRLETNSSSVSRNGENTNTLQQKLSGQVDVGNNAPTNLQAEYNRHNVEQRGSSTQITTDLNFKGNNLLVAPNLQGSASRTQVETRNNGSDSLAVSGQAQFDGKTGSTTANLRVNAESTRVAENGDRRVTTNQTVNGQLNFSDNQLSALADYNRQRILQQAGTTIQQNDFSVSGRASDLLGSPNVQASGKYEQTRGNTSLSVGVDAQLVPTLEVQNVEAQYQNNGLTLGAKYTPQNGQVSGSVGYQGNIRNRNGEQTGQFNVKIEANPTDVSAQIGIEAKF